MKIQVINHAGFSEKIKGDGIEVNKFHDAKSFDDYDINVVLLNDEKIWENTSFSTTNTKTIDGLLDLNSLGISIKNTSKSVVVIVYPQNYRFIYKEYDRRKEIDLKNIINNLQIYILPCLLKPLSEINFYYDNATAKIGDSKLEAAFVFDDNNRGENCIESTSGKTVGISFGDVIITTLNITNYAQLLVVLQRLGLIEDNSEEPLWAKNITMFDDCSLRTTIEENEEIINNASAIIEDAKKKLEVNSRYKSILYSHGSYLEDVVKEILSDMLDLDFSGFVDEKHEDFSAEKDGWYVLGEIKGVSHNIKNGNISQLEVHYQNFLDNHDGIDKEKVIALLIMSHQNATPIAERQKVNDEQIRLAEKYGSLIIEASLLLRMFEKYKIGELSSSECFEIIKNTKGFLHEEDLNH